MPITLVTGGAGFIGSHLVRSLVDQGYHVRVLDDLSSGRESNLHGVAADLIVGDICNRELVERVMQGVELVFHLGAFVSVPESMVDPLRCYEVNLMGSLSVLLAARLAGVRKVVLSSSCAVYGNAEGAVSEEARPTPNSPYASSKLAMEQLAKVFNDAYGLSTLCLRYFNVYGPHQLPNSPYAAVIPIFIKALLSERPVTINGDGLQTRDFVYVEDVVKANLMAAQAPNGSGGVYNIAGFGPISIVELFDRLKAMIAGNSEAIFGPPRPGDVRHSSAIRQLAERTLGYHPEIALERGLQLTVQWLKAERKRARW
jgi:nucleoside-diphosphate-sugar epimerase